MRGPRRPCPATRCALLCCAAQVGAYLAWFVRFLMLLTAPITWPIGEHRVRQSCAASMAPAGWAVGCAVWKLRVGRGGGACLAGRRLAVPACCPFRRSCWAGCCHCLTGVIRALLAHRSPTAAPPHSPNLPPAALPPARPALLSPSRQAARLGAGRRVRAVPAARAEGAGVDPCRARGAGRCQQAAPFACCCCRRCLASCCCCCCRCLGSCCCWCCCRRSPAPRRALQAAAAAAAASPDAAALRPGVPCASARCCLFVLSQGQPAPPRPAACRRRRASSPR